MTEQHYIEVKDLVKNYGTGSMMVNAVDHVSFYVDRGEFIGIMGASGSGKTTMLNVLSTIDTMSDGHVSYDGTDILKMREEELADFRQKNLGFVFQDYNLLDTLSIEENIMLPMSLCGRKKEEVDFRVKSISETLGICDILGKFPYEVSGGQKQRAACARALANDPKLILADEPTGALDSRSSAMLLDTLQVMNKELGATILMVTHDVFSACYCDRILFLSDGKIYCESKRGNLNKREYLDRIFDIQAQMGGVELLC
ncbi:MAG: ABC transporter ATP-binding protein [Lachnospiraceae bacterium]|nr:ABC transporter ATP-binding protein [Lachnospiraceae bacterium]MDE7176471.1 ABC transporter ATP-binding protein [Lachnospiraceae bacterium]